MTTGYVGPRKVRGDFTVTNGAAADTIDISYSLTGLEPGATGGWHVHTGKSCATKGDPGGHYFGANDVKGPDPWTGVTYTADGTGAAQGVKKGVKGFTLASVMGNTVVVHDKVGSVKIGCGVVGMGGQGTAYVARYPEYTGGIGPVTGSFVVTEMGNGITARTPRRMVHARVAADHTPLRSRGASLASLSSLCRSKAAVGSLALLALLACFGFSLRPLQLQLPAFAEFLGQLRACWIGEIHSGRLAYAFRHLLRHQSSGLNVPPPWL